MTNPCINCIVLPVCKQLAIDEYRKLSFCIKHNERVESTIRVFTKKCKLLYNYLILDMELVLYDGQRVKQEMVVLRKAMEVLTYMGIEKVPCDNCITLPICLSNFSSSYRHLEIDYGQDTLLLFYSVINLKDKCEIIKEFLFNNYSDYNRNLYLTLDYYNYKLNLMAKSVRQSEVDSIIRRTTEFRSSPNDQPTKKFYTNVDGV